MENGNPYWLSVIHFPKQCLKKPKPRTPVAPGCAPPAGAFPTIVNAICLPMTLPCVYVGQQRLCSQTVPHG